MMTPLTIRSTLGTWLFIVSLTGAVLHLHAQRSDFAQSGAATPSAQTSSETTASSDDEGKITREGAFTSFVETSFCMEIFTQQENARTGTNMPVIDWDKVNRTAIHLSEDEWSDVNRILTDTCQKLDDWRTQFSQAVRGPDGEFPMDPRKDTPQREAKIKEVGSQRGVILRGALQSLKQTLGDDSFKKFDDFVYQLEGGGHYITGAPLPKSQTTPGSSVSEEPNGIVQ